MDFFFLGLFDLLIGVTIDFFGLRFFFALLPIGAFFIGGYAGAMAVLGALLIFNRVETDDLQDGPTPAMVNRSWF